MSSGRGTPILAAALVALACAAIPASAMADTDPAIALSAKQRTKFIFLKAKVVSDGFVTPGQPETISISRMAPRAQIRVFIEPPPTTLQCGEFFFCDPAPAGPAPGSPPFKASGKGNALLTFITPDTYFLETDPFDPTQRTPVKFVNGQRIHIDVEGSSRTKRVRRQAFGFARAGVVLAP